MNLPPSSFIRVAAGDLHRFVAALGRAVGLPEDRAELLAELLVANDLRGVFSHGTTQMATYAGLMHAGTLNATPDVRVINETPTSVLVDGDGGLGYFPAWEMAGRVVEKASAQGIAVGLTRNHGHFGAAGLYSRRTLPHDLLSFVTSGHQLGLKPGQPIAYAAGGSPMSFSAPAGEETSLLLDFGTMHDLYSGSRFADEIAKNAPGLVFRGLGLGMVCQSWGGFLAGVPLDPARADRKFSGANQGSLVMALRIDLFTDPATFKAEMDAYVRAVRQLQPVPGFDQAFLPGGIEAEREKAYRVEGVPVGPEHRERLEQAGKEFSVPVPW